MGRRQELVLVPMLMLLYVRRMPYAARTPRGVDERDVADERGLDERPCIARRMRSP